MRSSTFSRALVQDSFRYSFCKDADQALLAPAKHSIFARGLASGFLPLEYPFFMFYLGLPRTRSTQTICLMQISWLSFFAFFLPSPFSSVFLSFLPPPPFFLISRRQRHEALNCTQKLNSPRRVIFIRFLACRCAENPLTPPWISSHLR